MKKTIAVKIANKIIEFLLPNYHLVPNKLSSSWRKLNIYNAPDFLELVQNKAVSSNSLLKHERLYSIHQSLRWIASQKNENFLSLEVGVYKGGGSFFITKGLTELSDHYLGHYAVDTFEGHEKADIPNQIEGGHTPGMFSDTSFGSVEMLLHPLKNAKIMASRIQDACISYTNIGFVHLDTDLSAPTKFVIEKMFQEAVAPYVILVDDYGFSTCPGVKEAVDDCIMANKSIRLYHTSLTTGQYVIVAIN